MQTLKSSQAMADAMRGVTTAMKSMNTKLNLPSLQNILKEFERQNEKMEMTTEVMGDAIDDAFEGEDEEGVRAARALVHRRRRLPLARVAGAEEVERISG